MAEHEVPGSSEVEKGTESLQPSNGGSKSIPPGLSAEDQAKLAELEEQLEKFESQKRWADVIRTIIAKAEIVPSPAHKVALLSRAGSLYVERSANQAEAIKCFERVLEHDSHNADAIERLKGMYEKRRDWERLVGVMQLEADQLPEGERVARVVEIATLASERLRKPQVCIELWDRVLAEEPGHPGALSHLANLHKRAQNWEPLARVLEQLVDLGGVEEQELRQQLQNLGMIYADKLNDDAGAIRAFRRLLALDPDDRRAQEQLKRRYVALRAWDDLEDFFGAAQKWDELIRILEREAEGEGTSDEERADLLFKVARLWIDQKDKPDRAARAYEKILAKDADNRRAAEALTPIYEEANDARKLVGVYAVRLKHAEEEGEKLEFLRKAGTLYEERLRDPEAAYDHFLRAFKLAPLDEQGRSDVERLAEATGAWDKLVEAYEEAREESSDPDEQTTLAMGLAGTLAKLGRSEDAIAQYRAVSEARPDHVPSIRALGELYSELGRHEDLLDALGRLLDLEDDPDARRPLAYRRAALCETQPGGPDKAIEAYRSLIDEYGEAEADAYRALERLYETGEHWEELAAVLQKRIELNPESQEELAALKFRLGVVVHKRLSATIRAVELYREVLTLLPEHDGASEGLEELLADEEAGALAARILEPIYEARSEWAKLVRALRVLHQASEEPEERLSLLRRVADIQEEYLRNPASAFDALVEALREQPGERDVLRRLEMLGAEQDKLQAVVDLLHELAKNATDPDLCRSLWLRSAQLSEQQLSDVEGAVFAFRSALELNPADREVLASLEALFRSTNRWLDLIGVVRRKAEIAPAFEEKEQLLAQVAQILDDQLGDPLSAIGVYREILELDPGSEVALVALDHLFEREQMWSDLADNVDRQLAMSNDPAEQLGFMLRLAYLRESRMNAIDAAIEIYREVLDQDPANEPALSALERLLATEAHQSMIADILEPLYRGMHEYAKLIAVHEIQARHHDSPERRLELFHQIGELYEVALDDPRSAFDSYARALPEDPTHAKTQQELDRLARAIGGLDRLAQAYESQVEQVRDPSVASPLLLKAATLREHELGQMDHAIAHYERVLELDPQCLEAADALERLFQRTERYEQLAKVHLTKSSIVTSTEEQKHHLFQAGALYEQMLESPQEAVSVYQKLLELDPEEQRALDRLIELYLHLARWEPLLDVYARKADLVVEVEEKKRLLMEMGVVYERELGNAEKAIDMYQRILEIDPDDMVATGRLDALYQAAGNWQELLSVLERESELAFDAGEAISYRYRIAELWHRHLDDAIRAVDIYRDILEAYPDHEPTIQALESLLDDGEIAIASAGVLEPVYRQFGNWARLIRVHEVQVQQEVDPVRAVELLHRIAELYEFQLESPREAFDAYARALPRDLRNDNTLGSLERLAEQLGAWGDVARLYDVEIARKREENPDEAADLALRGAMIYEIHLGNVDRAIGHYKLVSEVDPGHVQAIEALDRLYEATQRWPELAETLQREILVAASPDEVLRLQFRLGQLNQTRLGRIEQAIEHYREILAAAPEHVEALGALEGLFQQGVHPLEVGEILEPLYRIQEAWDRWVWLQEHQLQFQAQPEERLALMHRMAEVAEERLGDHEQASCWMQRALLEDPSHDHSQAEVERLASIVDGWAQLADTYASVLDRAESGADLLAAVGLRLARVYETQLDDIQRAEAAFRYVLRLQPGQPQALEALDRLYETYGSYEPLVHVLRFRIQATDNVDDRVEFEHRLGHVLHARLERTAEAIEVFEHLLAQTDPTHGPTICALQDIFTDQGDWPRLFGAFERELDVVTGDAAQANVLAKMAWLAADRLSNPERAIELWQRVLDLRGEDAEALNALGDIYAAQENWRDLVEVLEREVAVVEDDSDRLLIYADLGRIWYEKLERERNALESWERVIDIDPGRTDALFEIASIYRNGGQHLELVDTLLRLIQVGAATLEDALLEGAYMELGELYTTKLEQPMDGADAYRHALQVRSNNFAALEALESIYRQEEQWEQAISVMEHRVGVQVDAGAKVAGLLEIAKSWDEHVGQADRGTSAYARVLDLDPLHQGAFEALEHLHREAGRWEDLIEMYLGRIENLEDTTLRGELLRRVAKVYEESLQDPGQAFDALVIAWTEDLDDRQTATELERLAALTKRWNELLAAANDMLQETEDPQTRIAICLHCARWYGQELGHPEYAIPYYQQILAADPGNVPAVRQMVELYRLTEQWQTLGQVLQRLVEMSDDHTEKASAYVQMGDLCEQHLGVPEQSSSYYQRALEEDPKFVGALVALERIYRRQSQWGSLLDVLKRKAAAVETAEEIVAAKLQLADVYNTKIEDLDAAVTTYREVIELDPYNAEALKNLEVLYEQQQNWGGLLGVLEAELEIIATEKERISLLTRLAGMLEEEFLKPERAAERLEQVLEIDPVNVAALESLARVYRNTQRWSDVIQTYERHVQAAPDREEKVRLLKAAAQVQAAELGDLDQAVDAYLNALSLVDDDPEALDSVARLFEKQGDIVRALEMMERLTPRLEERSAQVELLFRMGNLFDEHLGDRETAAERYQQAVDLDPSHLPSLEALRKLYVDAGDWLAAARVLEQEAKYNESNRVVASRLVALARIYDERLDEHERAVATYEAAQERDPDNEESALALVDEWIRTEQSERVFPLLQMLVKRSQKREAEEQHRLCFQLGEVAMDLGEYAEAVKAFSKAHELDSTHLPSLMGVASAYYAQQDWDKAFKYYQMLLVHHRDALGEMEITEVFHRLGVIKNAQGDRRKALNMFEKALEEDSHHRPTLEAMVSLYADQRDWQQVIQLKKQILEVVSDDERFELLEEIGDLWKEKVGNAQKGIEFYQEATDLQPENHKVLHKLLAAYQDTKQWEKAIEVIELVSDLDGRAEAQAKYAYTIGVITRDELKDPDGSIERFNKALDLDWSQLKAFEAINKILTAKKDWKQLERAFRKMLHRVVGKSDSELEFNLWHNLGIIYRDRQQQFESAAEAFKMASSLRPDDAVEHQILAELYARVPTRTADAIAEHQWLLRNDPYRVDSYRELYRLYFEARTYDKAWCLAATLSFLKKADAEQQKFYEQYRQQGMIRPRARLDNERWIKDLFHSEEDLFVGKIFEILKDPIHALKATSDKALHLHKKYEVDPESSTVTFARTFGFVSQVLHLQIVPRLFLRPDAQGALLNVAGSAPPAMVCGSSLLSGFSPQDLAFVVGRHLAVYYRGEHFIRTLLTSTAELKTLLLAGIALAGIGPAEGPVQEVISSIGRHLQPVQLEALRKVCRRFVESGARADIKRWINTTELTGCRAGFLVCNDLETAARMIQALPPEGPNDMPPKDKVKEVVLFSVSEEYFRLREALGIQIKV